jgi:hypothetical protein
MNLSFVINDNGAGWMFGNNGLGPAFIQAVKITVDDKPQITWRAVANALGISNAASFQYINPKKGVHIREGISNAYLWFNTRNEMMMIAQNRNRVVIRLCFCSLYEECWLTSNWTASPQKVDTCTNQWPESDEFRGTLEP